MYFCFVPVVAEEPHSARKDSVSSDRVDTPPAIPVQLPALVLQQPSAPSSVSNLPPSPSPSSGPVMPHESESESGTQTRPPLSSGYSKQFQKSLPPRFQRQQVHLCKCILRVFGFFLKFWKVTGIETF